jgi:hypothetical protein
LLGLRVDFEEIFAREDFATGVEEPQASHIDEFVEHAEVFFRGHFTAACIPVAHGQVVIAMLALEWAAPRDFDGDLQGRTLSAVFLVKIRAKGSVS